MQKRHTRIVNALDRYALTRNVHSLNKRAQRLDDDLRFICAQPGSSIEQVRSAVEARRVRPVLVRLDRFGHERRLDYSGSCSR